MLRMLPLPTIISIIITKLVFIVVNSDDIPPFTFGAISTGSIINDCIDVSKKRGWNSA